MIGCRRCRRCCSRCWPSSRCRSSPASWPPGRATTSTSRATWPSRSPSSDPVDRGRRRGREPDCHRRSGRRGRDHRGRDRRLRRSRFAETVERRPGWWSGSSPRPRRSIDRLAGRPVRRQGGVGQGARRPGGMVWPDAEMITDSGGPAVLRDPVRSPPGPGLGVRQHPPVPLPRRRHRLGRGDLRGLTVRYAYTVARIRALEGAAMAEVADAALMQRAAAGLSVRSAELLARRRGLRRPRAGPRRSRQQRRRRAVRRAAAGPPGLRGAAVRGLGQPHAAGWPRCWRPAADVDLADLGDPDRPGRPGGRRRARHRRTPGPAGTAADLAAAAAPTPGGGRRPAVRRVADSGGAGGAVPATSR